MVIRVERSPLWHFSELLGTTAEMKKSGPSEEEAGLHAVEHRRIELLTFCLQSRCSTN